MHTSGAEVRMIRESLMNGRGDGAWMLRADELSVEKDEAGGRAAKPIPPSTIQEVVHIFLKREIAVRFLYSCLPSPS